MRMKDDFPLQKGRGNKTWVSMCQRLYFGSFQNKFKSMLTTTLGRDCIKSLFFSFLPRGGKFTEESVCHTVSWPGNVNRISPGLWSLGCLPLRHLGSI